MNGGPGEKNTGTYAITMFDRDQNCHISSTSVQFSINSESYQNICTITGKGRRGRREKRFALSSRYAHFRGEQSRNSVRIFITRGGKTAHFVSKLTFVPRELVSVPLLHDTYYYVFMSWYFRISPPRFIILQ